MNTTVNTTFSERVKEQLSFKHIGKYAPYMLLAVLVIFFGIVTDGKLFRPMNISNIFVNNSYLFFLSCGLFFCILTGNTDLSLGSLIGLISAVLGYTHVTMGWPIGWSLLLCAVLGVVCGCLHGLIITKCGLTPFLTTLAANFIYRGLCEFILKGDSLSPLHDGLKTFAKDFILEDLRVGGINVFCAVFFVILAAVLIVSEVRSRNIKRRYRAPMPSLVGVLVKDALILAFLGVIMYFFNSYKGVPIIVVVVGVFVAVYYFIATKSTFGRHVYAVGGSMQAAKLCGINVNRVMFLVYLNSAVLATFAAVAVCGRVNSAMTSAGDGYHMDAICACYIGGAAGSGGSGNLLSSIVGAFIMALLLNGMTLCGLGSSLQNVCKGLALLAAVAFDVYSRSKVSD
ncbi:MAG TPA: sugar ABC transporter permease [Candidatus Pullichristensenella excrementigallinarum]|uniref:Xylose transport system permease protein XylH n=1 Tax=Candidatus Pullichristensenella excrementigallinarum TaxID=2840907 RepID=A0A9D1LC14_9FIRM|nr:sugar ABC transporter permease [Candidatus Pullichristensenella excrementigallinarum]